MWSKSLRLDRALALFERRSDGIFSKVVEGATTVKLSRHWSDTQTHRLKNEVLQDGTWLHIWARVKGKGRAIYMGRVYVQFSCLTEDFDKLPDYEYA